MENIPPKLYIMNGPDKGKVFTIEKDETTIGRVKNNDLQIKEKSISRKHLLIKRKEDKYFIRDLNGLVAPVFIDKQDLIILGTGEYSLLTVLLAIILTTLSIILFVVTQQKKLFHLSSSI